MRYVNWCRVAPVVDLDDDSILCSLCDDGGRVIVMGQRPDDVRSRPYPWCQKP